MKVHQRSHSKKILFWFRRDLRLEDNVGLSEALAKGSLVQPLFIFDEEILGKLEDRDDARVTFIHQRITELKGELQSHGSDLWVRHGSVFDVFKKLLKNNDIEAIYTNHDYEPSAIARDLLVQKIAYESGVPLLTFKDQVIFEKDDLLTGQMTPYTIYTPYKKKWLDVYRAMKVSIRRFDPKNLHQTLAENMISLKEIGFLPSKLVFPTTKIHPDTVKNYHQTRDLPFLEKGTTHLGLHFRFGTISPRKAVQNAQKLNQTWLSELIWREFFMQILANFPHVVSQSFRKEYEQIAWREASQDFERWKSGETGYPLVDAGMRELNTTGYMHNRVRMVVASFLCKHLLIHWLKGERYFARKLLDYDLSANNGNWQWAAGSGCDAAPYFRVFNPETQMKKFDPQADYVTRWVPEWKTSRYPEPMVVHEKARERALAEYKRGLGRTKPS